MPEPEIRWNLPARGPVGMYCLIAAEAAIFTIFVVAYIFYIGKSLTGPQPQDVLHVPIFFTICLLSSSLTIHLAVRALRRGSVSVFGTWWFATMCSGRGFPVWNCNRVAPADLSRRLDHQHEPVRDHLLLTGWTARISRRRRPDCSHRRYGVRVSRERETGAC